MDTVLELLRGLVPSVLLIGALLFVRRGAARGRTRGGDKMRVAERVGVSRGASVAVVEIDGRRFLVGATEHGVNLLSELAEQTESVVAPEAAIGARLEAASQPPFSAILHAMTGRGAASPDGAMLSHRALQGGGFRGGMGGMSGMGLLDRLRSLTARGQTPGAAS